MAQLYMARLTDDTVCMAVRRALFLDALASLELVMRVTDRNG